VKPAFNSWFFGAGQEREEAGRLEQGRMEGAGLKETQEERSLHLSEYSRLHGRACKDFQREKTVGECRQKVKLGEGPYRRICATEFCRCRTRE